MDDPIIRQLKSEPRKELRSFFAANVAARAGEDALKRRSVWLVTYWIAVALLSIWILWRGNLAVVMIAVVAPVAVLAALSGWRRTVRRFLTLLK